MHIDGQWQFVMHIGYLRLSGPGPITLVISISSPLSPDIEGASLASEAFHLVFAHIGDTLKQKPSQSKLRMFA